MVFEVNHGVVEEDNPRRQPWEKRHKDHQLRQERQNSILLRRLSVAATRL
jgi:hypothetical protein